MNWIGINDAQKPADHELVAVLLEWRYTGLHKTKPVFMRPTADIAEYIGGEFYINGEAEPAVTHWLKVPDAPVDTAGYSHSEQGAV